MKSLKKNILVLGLVTCFLFILTSFGSEISLGVDEQGGTLQKKTSPWLELKLSHLEGIQEEVLTGCYSVYEDRNSRQGRRLQLNVVVLPATGRKQAADPVFFLSGGPGEGASDSIGFFTQGFESLREKRDIVFVDQRGTGRSNPLTCEFSSLDEALHGLLTFSFQPGMIERCRKELEAKADLRYYTTPIAMDDLDDVRQALGYDRINLLGISYGTRSAMVYMRSHGEHVRSAVLRAVAPVNMKAILPAARHGQAALQALIEDCLAEEASRNAYPDIQEKLHGVLKNLFERPLLLDAINPLTGQKEQIHMTRDLFAGGIYFLLAHTDSTAYVPLVIDQASHQDFGPFLETVIPVGLGLSRALSLGVSLTTMCSEDTPLISGDEIAQATAATFLGSAKVVNQIRLCGQWPRGYLPDGYNQPISSEIPVLMISGEFDPVDGLDLARGIEKNFPNAVHLVIPDGAHQPSFPGCVRDLVQAFMERGHGDSLDVACLKQIKRKPFKPNPEVILALDKLGVREQNPSSAAREEDTVTVDYEMAERALEWLEYINTGANEQSVRQYFLERVASTKGCQAIIHHWARFKKWNEEEFFRFIMESLGRIPVDLAEKGDRRAAASLERRMKFWESALANPARIKRDLEDLKKTDLKKAAVVLARKYLPDDAVVSNDFYFVLFGASTAFSVGKENGFDLLQLPKTKDGRLDVDQIVLTIAHELHHSGFSECVERNTPRIQEDDRIMLLGILAAEGMPTYFINKPFESLEEMKSSGIEFNNSLAREWENNLSRLTELYREAEKDIRLNFKGVIGQKDIFEKWMGGLQGPAYALGSAMFSTIEKNLGFDSARLVPRNILEFLVLYNKAADKENQKGSRCFIFDRELVDQIARCRTPIAD